MTNTYTLLYISNVNVPYQSSNKVNYLAPILKYNGQCTGVDCMGETPQYHALQG